MLFTTRPVIMATRGVVAAGHYLAAGVGLDVLARGGNAIDAGVAASFALTLVKPHECGLGGECPILIYTRAPIPGPNPLVINGQGTAPRRTTIEFIHSLGLSAIPGTGPLAATVPATFGALVTALMRFGRFGLRETLGPVLELAREGYAMYPALREVLQQHEDRCRNWPATADIYLSDGRVPPVGSRVRPHALVRTLTRILDTETRSRRRGRIAALNACLDAFYRGPIAGEIGEFVAAAESADRSGQLFRGTLDTVDMAEYQTRIEAPVTAQFRGLDIYKCGPWSQGPVFLQQLALLDAFDLAGLGHNSPRYIHTVVEAAKLAFADRENFYGDPAFVDVPLECLLSQEYNEHRRKLIDPERASEVVEPGWGSAATSGLAAEVVSDHGDTTHVDVIDAEGNMFSGTPSGGWIQSSPVIPALGFPLGTRAQQFSLELGHPNALAPRKRPRTTLTPSLVMHRNQPYMVFGTEGGDNQDQWTLQFFLNVIEFGMDLQAAADAPLFHTTHFPSSFYPHEVTPRGLVVEGRIPAATRARLAEMNHRVIVAEDWSAGQVTGVRLNGQSGIIEGAASPRSMAAYVIGR